MKWKNKRNFSIFLILILIFGVFIKFGISGEMKHIIFSPYETIIGEQTVEISSELLKSKTATLTTTSIANKFEEMDEYGSYDSITEPFCQLGGLYKIDVSLDMSEIADEYYKEYNNIDKKYDENFNLYYCYTTKDFLERISIPASWSSNNLIVYCNDGSLINVINTNFELFTNKINTYKACVVKNLDLEEGNTIVYGMEVGNSAVDSNKNYFYDEGKGSGPAIAEFTGTGGGTFLDENEREFKLQYDGENKIFAIADFEADFSQPLSGIFDLEGLELSRVVFFKKIGSKKIVGYETVAKFATELSEYEESLKTVYTIKLDGFGGFNGRVCPEVLAQYETQANSAIMQGVDIVCNDNTIQIISDSLDGVGRISNPNIDSSNSNMNSEIKSGTKNQKESGSTSYHVFKNIILSLE